MIHMEGIKGGGGGRVGVGEDDLGGDGMQCIDHPHRTNPGGICAFCLQEKLGKLVSSSFPLPIRASSSSSPSSSSPSFRSNNTLTSSKITTAATSSAPSAAKKNNRGSANHYNNEHYMRSRLPFLLAKKKKKPSLNSSSSSASVSAAATSDIIFKRSKSTATPRRRGQFLHEDDLAVMEEDLSPRKRNKFWSFLYLSSKSSSSKKLDDAKSFRDNNNGGTPRISAVNSAERFSGVKTTRDKDKSLGSSLGRKSETVVEESDDASFSASVSSFERKVSRSRSVGCGSRSFSGDFFERISTGLGDCTLRRVESQREGKSKVASSSSGVVMNNHHHCMKERVRCGGIFGGFMITSSSSSSSSSYWISSNNDGGDSLSHGGRGSRSWGWAFASPMRAFSSGKINSSRDNRREKDGTPNLSTIPSSLTVRV